MHGGHRQAAGVVVLLRASGGGAGLELELNHNNIQ